MCDVCVVAQSKETTALQPEAGAAAIDNNNTLANELLCFVSRKMDLMTSDHLIKVCSEFYSEREIESAKLVANDACGLYGTPAKRNGAYKKEKHLKDILLYLHEADYVPRFVAHDIRRFPPISINHMDATAIVQEMNQLRLHVSSLCATVTSLLDGQLEMKTQISLLQRKPTHVSTANTTVEPTSARCEPPPCEASGSRPEDISPMSNNTSDSSPTLAKMPVTPILPRPLLSPPPPMSPRPWSSFQQVSLQIWRRWMRLRLVNVRRCVQLLGLHPTRKNGRW